MRRTAVGNFARAGVNEKIAVTLAGHKTREVFDRYHIADEAELAVAVTIPGEASFRYLN